MREARLSSQLKHEGIVAVKAFGRSEEGFLYIVQEFAEGETLSSLLLRQTPALSQESMKKIALDITEALGYAHSQNILHRDLKPSNIMIRSTEEILRAKILDFGLAAAIEVPEEQQKLTATGVIAGTAAYMSPERCRGEKASTASDIYSLGCILYEMLYGTPPFKADSDLQIMSMHLNESPSYQGNCKISHGLKKILSRCLNKMPEERYPDCKVLWNCLYLS